MDIEKLAREAGFDGWVITARDNYDEPNFTDYYSKELTRFAALVVEECAKVAESGNSSGALSPIEVYQASFIADAIRSLIKPSSPEAQSPDERPL